MLRYVAHSRASSDIAWALVARPRAWSEWAPHLRGAWGLGSPEVRPGALGSARLLGVIPIPARITAKDATGPIRSWTWRIGIVEMDHEVLDEPDGGCWVAVTMRAPAPVEAVLRVTYGPVIGRLVRRLAHIAERRVTPSGFARPR